MTLLYHTIISFWFDFYPFPSIRGNVVGLNVEAQKTITIKLFTIMTNFELSQSAKNEMKIEIARRNMQVSESAANESSMSNFEINTLFKGLVFAFVEGVSDTVYDVPVRNSARKARAVFVATGEGATRLLYPSSLRRSAQEAAEPVAVGEVAPLTGKSYVANHEDFDQEKPATKFFASVSKFPNDKAMFESLAKNGVQVEVLDRKTVRTRRFDDQSRTQNTPLVIIEFAGDDKQVEKWEKALMKDAEKAANINENDNED